MAAVEAVVRYRWVILGVSLLCQLGASLASKVLAPLAPLFQAELGLTKAEVGLFSSAAFAGALAVLLIAGSITDRFGIGRIMSLGQVATGLCLLCMSAVGSVVQAAAVMFAAGLGRGTVFPGATKAVMEWFPPSERATAMGVKQVGAPVGGIVAAATLPLLGLALGWRAAIAVVGLIVITAGVVTGILYRDPRRSGQPSPPKAGIRAGLEDTLHNRRLWALGCVSVFFVMAQQALVLYLPLYFTEIVLVREIPEEAARIVAAGWFLALCQMGGVVGRPSWGIASDRIFHGRRSLVLALIGGIGAVLLLMVGRLAAGYPLWVVTLVIFVAGMSSVAWNGLYHTALAEASDRRYAGTAVGFGMTMVEGGTTVGPPLFGLVVDLASWDVAWVFAAALSAAGALVALLSVRGEGRVAEEVGKSPGLAVH